MSDLHAGLGPAASQLVGWQVFFHHESPRKANPVGRF